MLVRKPDIILQQNQVIWSRTPEVALVFDAMSAVIPHIEHYLNNVIKEVRRDHVAHDPALGQRLDDFIGQETEHSRVHMLFNATLFERGYAELQPLLKAITLEYRDLRKRHSLAYHTAYCAGFENCATFSAKYVLGPGLKHFEGADPSGANLILWHVAEEFEHRAVCHDAFRAVSSNYFLRLRGLLRAFAHVMSCFWRACVLMVGIYQRNLSAEEVRQSNKRLRGFLLGMFGYMAPRMLVLLIPAFHPENVRPPRSLETVLAYFSGAGPVTQVYSPHAA